MAAAEMLTLTGATQSSSLLATPSPGPGLMSQDSSLDYPSLARLGSTPSKLQEAELGSQDTYRSKWDDEDDAQDAAESATMHEQLHLAAADAEDCDSWDDLLSKPY